MVSKIKLSEGRFLHSLAQLSIVQTLPASTVRSLKGFCQCLIILATAVILTACPLQMDGPPSQWQSDWSEISETDRQSYFRRLTPTALNGFVAEGWNVNTFVKGANLGSGDVLPIHLAARYGASAEVINWLVAQGNNVNAKLANGSANGRYTPLHFAALSGNLATVKALVAAGADKSAQMSNNWGTPFILAVSRNPSDLSIVQALAITGPPGSLPAESEPFRPYGQSSGNKTLGGLSALEFAINRGNIPLLNYLVELAGTSINNPISYGSYQGLPWLQAMALYPLYPQFTAETFKAFLMSEYIILDTKVPQSAGENPTTAIQATVGWTILHCIVQRSGNEKAIEFLDAMIASGKSFDKNITADTDPTDSTRLETPFAYATRLGRPQALIDKLRP